MNLGVALVSRDCVPIDVRDMVMCLQSYHGDFVFKKHVWIDTQESMCFMCKEYVRTHAQTYRWFDGETTSDLLRTIVLIWIV